MKRLAITGITGKNGKFLFQKMLSNEKEILKEFPDGFKFCVRNQSRASFVKYTELEDKVIFVNGDTENKNVTDELLKDCSAVLHIAGIRTSINIMLSAVKHNVKRVILVHTTGIYSKYKEAGEEYRNIEAKVYEIAKENNINLTILRPTMIYGTVKDRNICTFIKMVDKLPFLPMVNGGHYELQPVHCADLGNAFYQVLINAEVCNNKDYILSGGAPIELREIFVQISKNLGVQKQFISCPYPIAYAGALTLYLLSFTKIDFREKVQRLCEPRTFNYDDARRDFGYSPRTFQEGVVQEVKDYLNGKNQ